jgi:hypothetical protein
MAEKRGDGWGWGCDCVVASCCEQYAPQRAEDTRVSARPANANQILFSSASRLGQNHDYNVRLDVRTPK